MHDCHSFFHHVSQNLGASIYRIFEPQYKAEILHWFGREDVATEQKEEFIQALIDFDDGCGNFYRYRAYFLAAEALSQFQNCSLGDTIATQILKWSYNYFRQDKRDWKILPEPLVKAARAVLEVTDRKRVIAAFVHLVHTTQSRTILRLAAEKLGKLDPGNKSAIAALALLIQVTQDEYTLCEAIHSLGEIGSGNETAIAALVHVIETTLNKNDCGDAIAALGRIGYGNQTAISAFIRFLQINQGDIICFDAAQALWQINPGNTAALNTVVQLLKTTQNQYHLYKAAAYLVQIDPGNKAAIDSIVKILESTQSGSILKWATEYLAEFASEHINALARLNEVIAVLSAILETTEDEYLRCMVAASLVKFAPDHVASVQYSIPDPCNHSGQMHP